LRTIALKSVGSGCSSLGIGSPVVVARDVVAENVLHVPGDYARRRRSTTALVDGPVKTAALELLHERDKASGGGAGCGHTSGCNTFYIKLCENPCRGLHFSASVGVAKHTRRGLRRVGQKTTRRSSFQRAPRRTFAFDGRTGTNE
jgi:hypothetical protein